MTFDLKRILECKRQLRRNLAARPIAEKLAMLDALRVRTLQLRGNAHPAAVNEAPEKYGTLPRPRRSKDSRQS